MKKSELAKRVPVLIDRKLYNWFKKYAETANEKPVAVSSVIRYALQEFQQVTEDVTIEVPFNVVDIREFVQRSQSMQPQDMN